MRAGTGSHRANTRAEAIMRPGGKIINMLDQCVARGLPGGAFYSAAFAFLHATQRAE